MAKEVKQMNALESQNYTSFLQIQMYLKVFYFYSYSRNTSTAVPLHLIDNEIFKIYPALQGRTGTGPICAAPGRLL